MFGKLKDKLSFKKEEPVIEEIKEKLDDLNKKTIEERIKQYREKTELIYDKISKSSDFIFFDIDGDRNILDVQEDIRSEIIATESFRTAKNIFNGESPFCPR